MKRILYFVSSLLFVAGCVEKENGEQNADMSEISVSTESLSFLNTGEGAGSGNSVTVTSSGAWTLIGKTDWCHPSVKEGVNGDAVTFAADPNPETEPRTAEFSFVCGSKTVKLYAVQSESSELVIFKDTFSVGVAETEIVVRAVSNTEISYEIEGEQKEWIKFKSSERIGQSDIYLFYFTVSASDIYRTRTGEITFKADNVSVPVAVNQDKNIILETDRQSYSEIVDGYVEVKVVTNLPYKVEIQDGASWISYETNPDAGVAPEDKVERIERFQVTGTSQMSRAVNVKISAIGGEQETSCSILQIGENPEIITGITDKNFAQALADIAYIVIREGSDGHTIYDLTDLGKNATKMNISGKNISSLEGLENFPKVETLDCSNNNIRVMDFSSNYIWIDYNNPGASNIDGNPIELLKCNKWIKNLRLSAGNGKRGLCSPEGVWSEKLKIESSALQILYVENNAGLKKLDIYDTPIRSNASCGLSGNNPGETFTVYVVPEFQFYGKLPDGLRIEKNRPVNW